LRLTLGDIAAVLEEAAQRAKQAQPEQALAADDTASAESAELIERLAALARELRDVGGRLEQIRANPPTNSGGPSG